MFTHDDLMFIKNTMTSKVIEDVEEYKQIAIMDVERALRIIEAIDPHSRLREQMVKKIKETENNE